MLTKKYPRKSYVVYVYTYLEKPYDKYIYLDVKEYYQEDGYLIIREYRGKRDYRYKIDTIDRIRVQERIEGQYWKMGKRTKCR